MADYRYDTFSHGAYDLDQFDGPALGQKAPNGPVTLLDGSKRDLLDFEGKFLVLEVGSITCPLFQSRRNGMASLVRRFREVDFAILYVREAHPGAVIEQPKDMALKSAHASRLRDEDGEVRKILLDDLEGSLHRAFGGYPNSLFILNRGGCVVWRSDWNNPRATAKALKRLTSGRSAGREGLFLPAKPPVVFRTLHRAGGSALTDFLRDLPHLIWKNVLKRNFRVLTGLKSPVGPDHRCS